MSSNVVYCCDRCGAVQTGAPTLHRVTLAISTVSGIEQAEKSADWCDTCLVSCGLATNGILDLTLVHTLTVPQLAAGLGKTYP